MTAQVSIWVDAASKTAALVELASGSNAIPLGTLQPGDQRQFQTFPGASIRVTEVPADVPPTTQETKA